HEARVRNPFDLARVKQAEGGPGSAEAAVRTAARSLLEHIAGTRWRGARPVDAHAATLPMAVFQRLAIYGQHEAVHIRIERVRLQREGHGGRCTTRAEPGLADALGIL